MPGGCARRDDTLIRVSLIRDLLRRAHRDLHVEPGAAKAHPADRLGGLRDGANVAAERLRDASHERETEADAAELPRRRAVDLEERFENFVDLIRRNSWAGVRDVELVVPARQHAHVASGFLHATGSKSPDRSHLRPGVGRGYRQNRQAGFERNGLGESSSRSAADGNATPLFCSTGAVNVLAWKFYADISASILGLGLNPNPGQPQSAMCDDIAHNGATRPEEVNGYKLAAAYYGWTFTFDPAKVICP